jgi:hypothetical protein
MNRKLEKLINIGPKVAAGLREIGVNDEAALKDMGYMEAFLRMRLISPHWNHKMLLYALYGAVNETNCMHLPDEIKLRLIEELNENCKN